MKILITGTAGFIGYHVADALIRNAEHEIIGIDNLNDYYDVQLKLDRLKQHGIVEVASGAELISAEYPNYKFTVVNLADRDAMQTLFNKHRFDVVIHLAAQAGVRYSLSHPHHYLESNVVGFLNILEGCRDQKVQHLIYASSSSVYGLNEEIPFTTTQNTDHPISLYAASKKSNELMAHVYSHLFQIPTTGLRFFTVYGPWGRPDMSYFLFTKAILAGEPIKVFNNGDMMRDFTYVKDVVDGILAVMQHPPAANSGWNAIEKQIDQSKAPYQIFNIGNHQPVQLLAFIEAIENAIGKKAIKEYLPLQPGDVQHTFADVTSLMQKTGYHPNTPVVYGVQQFVEWYKNYYCN